MRQELSHGQAAPAVTGRFYGKQRGQLTETSGTGVAKRASLGQDWNPACLAPKARSSPLHHTDPHCQLHTFAQGQPVCTELLGVSLYSSMKMVSPALGFPILKGDPSQ